MNLRFRRLREKWLIRYTVPKTNQNSANFEHSGYVAHIMYVVEKWKFTPDIMSKLYIVFESQSDWKCHCCCSCCNCYRLTSENLLNRFYLNRCWLWWEFLFVTCFAWTRKQEKFDMWLWNASNQNVRASKSNLCLVSVIKTIISMEYCKMQDHFVVVEFFTFRMGHPPNSLTRTLCFNGLSGWRTLKFIYNFRLSERRFMKKEPKIEVPTLYADENYDFECLTWRAMRIVMKRKNV